MTLHVPTRKPLDEAALAQLFARARTHNAFLDISVPDALLRQAVDLAKMGPTAVNSSPLRLLFLRSAEARERLRPALSAGNLEKTMKAPIVAIAAFDERFVDHLPFLFPHVDARPWFANPDLAKSTAALNGALQIAYFLLALRAVGLDAGPMSGFDAAKVDAEFFPGGSVKSTVLVNIGYGDASQLFPRSPRFEFDQIAKVI